jgi:hypothetical protein
VAEHSLPRVGPNRRAQEQGARRRSCCHAKRAEAERKAIADAQKIVAIWNARQAGGRCGSTRTSEPRITDGRPLLSLSCVI